MVGGMVKIVTIILLHVVMCLRQTLVVSQSTISFEIDIILLYQEESQP